MKSMAPPALAAAQCCSYLFVQVQVLVPSRNLVAPIYCSNQVRPYRSTEYTNTIGTYRYKYRSSCTRYLCRKCSLSCRHSARRGNGHYFAKEIGCAWGVPNLRLSITEKLVIETLFLKIRVLKLPYTW